MYGKHTPDAAAVTPGYGITAVYTAVLYLGTGITNIYRQNNRTSNSKSKLTKKGTAVSLEYSKELQFYY
jgi:hypothetical protein